MTGPEHFDGQELERFGREIHELPSEVRELLDVSPSELVELQEIAEIAEPFEGANAVSFGGRCSGCSGNCYSTCSGSCSGSCGGTCWATCSGRAR